MSTPPTAQTLMPWLIREGLVSTDLDTTFDGFCRRLVETGVPLARGHLSMPTLHPTIEGFGLTWRPKDGTAAAAWNFDNDPATYLASPFYRLVQARETRMRRRLDGNAAVLDFPILHEFKAEGLTDYVVTLEAFGDARTMDFDTDPLPGVAASWATARPGGFSDDDIATLDALLPLLALVTYRLSLAHVARSTLDAYIGPHAAARVLRGEIRRGMVTRQPAVVAVFDLCGFTAVADRTPGEQLIAWLNEHLDRMVGPIERNGGQVLKFVGDGLIAVFAPSDGDWATPCGNALAAAREAIAGTEALNRARDAAGAPRLDLDVALHMGEVMYGNIGSTGRLDFTMIGPAVNEASRIEALCDPLGRHLLASRRFAENCGMTLRSLGLHPLRGVSEPQELFTVD